MAVSDDECGRLVMEVALAVMREVREHTHRSGVTDLSVAQFRTLLMVRKHPGLSLSSLAEKDGLGSPSASQLVDGLVARGLLTRRISAEDRRRVELELTEAGLAELERVRAANHARLAALLVPLDEAERAALVTVLAKVRDLLARERGGEESEERP